MSYPAMNIVIQLVGSQGDVQPLVALGLELQNTEHLVRIAIHPVSPGFIEAIGLKLFSSGAIPQS